MEYLLYALFPQDFSSFTQGFMLTVTCYGIIVITKITRQYFQERDNPKLIVNRLQISHKEP